MENRIFNPYPNEGAKVFAKYNLGDVVVLRSFATHCLRVGGEFHFKESAPINVSPFMMIVRADRNEKEHRTDDRQSQDFVRYRCMWYDPNKGEFQEEVFFESLLFRIISYQNLKLHTSLVEHEKLLYGKTCIFRTREFEMRKVFPENQRFNRFREVVNFIPPDLIVAGFKIAKDIGEDKKYSEDIIFYDKNNNVIRYDEKNRIICEWYSTSQGKFLKKDFIPQVLSFANIMTNFVEG